MSDKPIPERHQTRYRLAQTQLGLLPSAKHGSEDEYAGLRFHCEEVMGFCEELGAAEAALSEAQQRLQQWDIDSTEAQGTIEQLELQLVAAKSDLSHARGMNELFRAQRDSLVARKDKK